MKKIFFKSLLLATIGFLITGCSEDFLDKNPIAEETEATFYDSFENLDLTATAAYGLLVMRDMDYFFFIPHQAACDDIEVGGQNLSDWPQWQNIDRLAHTASESRVFDEPYGYWYKGIRMANEFLSRVEDVVAEDESADEEVVTMRIAEMKYLKAFYHFQLLQVFGGVIICDEPVTPSEFVSPRNSVAEVLHYIEDILLEAIPDLKLRSEVAPNYGRATKGAAQSLLAKAYLYESSYAENYSDDDRFTGCVQKYDLALEQAQNVISSGEYELVGSDGETYDSWRDTKNGVDGFRWMFTVDGDNSKEGIWEAQNVADGRGWTYTRGSYYTIYTSARRYYLDDERTTEASSDQGWSFNIPSKYLVAAFGNQDRRETGLNSAEMSPLLDPRFKTTIGCGDTLTVNENVYTKEWDSIQFEDTDEGVDWYYISFSNIPAGTIHRKYECSVTEFWSADVEHRDNNGPMNIRYIRYADLILWAAEAAYKTNNTSLALQYVNMVRTRARMCGNTGYPEDLTAISFEDIVHERRLELACEPARWPDLVRWGLANKYIDGITLDALGDGVILEFEEGKHEFMPLPNSEVQLNTALEQYDGWK